MSSFVFRCTTRGSHTFLEFNTPVKIFDSVSGARLILEELLDFEKQNPDMHIVGWKPETHMATNTRFGILTPVCFGIWIDHEPREKEPEDCDFDALERALGQD
ncbi:MAG: hypothetical protein HYX21_03520 [Candidatus Yanofskybacteria bacterium]|nr:hypothetical protein [Candidatus Yanofskybacteria bacterium]